MFQIFNPLFQVYKCQVEIVSIPRLIMMPCPSLVDVDKKEWGKKYKLYNIYENKFKIKSYMFDFMMHVGTWADKVAWSKIKFGILKIDEGIPFEAHTSWRVVLQVEETSLSRQNWK